MARPSIILIEYRGKRWLLSELEEITGIPHNTIRQRFSTGWNVEQALGTPTPKQRRAGVVSNLDAFAEDRRDGHGSNKAENRNFRN